jgi:hypothetical protein
MDGQIADCLNNYIMANRPYGHGYLVSTYPANDCGDVALTNIADGR